MVVIRSKTKGAFKLNCNSAWGSYLTPIEDPEAQVDDADTRKFELIEGFPKIPASLWSRIVNLYFDYAKFGNLEVQVVLLRDLETKTRWKVIVPEQDVTGGSVRSEFTKCVDIETGKEYTYPEDLDEEWGHAGSSHSHNTMKLATFSGTDDTNELGVPGAHILVSSIDLKAKTYVITASVVQGKKRFIVPYTQMLESNPVSVAYHPKVKEYIKEEVWLPSTKGSAKGLTSTIKTTYRFFGSTRSSKGLKTEAKKTSSIDMELTRLRDLIEKLYMVDPDSVEEVLMEYLPANGSLGRMF